VDKLTELPIFTIVRNVPTTSTTKTGNVCMLLAYQLSVRYLRAFGIVLLFGYYIQAAPSPKDRNIRSTHPKPEKGYFGPDIFTVVADTIYCAGEEFNIEYTANIEFGSGNSFIVQLSNAAGTFVSPIAIGSLTDSRSGTMKVKIPFDIPPGKGYHIRTIGIIPQVTGRANEANITILAAPSISVSVGGSTTFCSGNSLTLTASSRENNYLWSNGATTPSIKVSESGDYSVTVSNPNGCSRTTAPIHVLVEQTLAPFTISSNKPPTICEGTRVELGVPMIEGVVYQWQRNGQNVGVSANALGVVEPGEYSVSMSNNCSKVSARLVVSLLAKVDPPVAASVGRCGPGSVDLTASGGHEGNYRWYNANDEPIAGATGSRLSTPVLSSSTTFYVTNERFGCESKKVAVPVTILPAPQINAGPDQVMEDGESVQLQGSGEGIYQWSSSATPATIQVAAPLVTPTKTTTYTLTVTDRNGCVASDEMTVVVHKKLFVPNAFTPNNDGVNDTWEITNIESRQDVKMEVFNRWGNKVYESVGYPQPWDGTVEGKELPVNTYFYVISLEGGRQRLTGAVSIVR
jgi:gliding motility-associated-like protein